VIALGIGFGTPLALAGVVVHIAGHAVAKALGFYAATPLLAHEPRAAAHAARGIVRTQPELGATMGISLAALAGLPPSPLLLSEVLIAAGGFQSGRPWAAGAAVLLLSLGFLGLAHALLEVTGGAGRARTRVRTRRLQAFAGVATLLLGALVGAAIWLPGSDVVAALLQGVS
jgi:hydrogenase-4 component F